MSAGRCLVRFGAGEEFLYVFKPALTGRTGGAAASRLYLRPGVRRAHARHGVRPTENAEVPIADELDDRDEWTRGPAEA